MFVSAGTTADATVGKQMKQVHNLTNCGVIRSDILDAPQPQKIILQAFKPVVDVQHTRVNRWREGERTGGAVRLRVPATLKYCPINTVQPLRAGGSLKTLKSFMIQLAILANPPRLRNTVTASERELRASACCAGLAPGNPNFVIPIRSIII